MSGRFKLEIKESEAELKKRLQTVREGSQKEKLQMLWLGQKWTSEGAAGNRQKTGKG